MRGDRIKQLRKTKKISQKKLADAIGVDRTSIGKYELKNVRPSIELIEKMAIFLETTPAFLLGVETPTNKKEAPLSASGKILMDIFELLDTADQEKIIEHARDLAGNKKYIPEAEETRAS
jgi:transcriptional regulator with XRE-family HTH domain